MVTSTVRSDAKHNKIQGHGTEREVCDRTEVLTHSTLTKVCVVKFVHAIVCDSDDKADLGNGHVIHVSKKGKRLQSGESDQ